MELPFDLTDVRDEPQYQRDGSIVSLKRATFYLGKYGPFVERLPNDDQFDVELRQRVDALRRKLDALAS